MGMHGPPVFRPRRPPKHVINLEGRPTVTPDFQPPRRGHMAVFRLCRCGRASGQIIARLVLLAATTAMPALGRIRQVSCAGVLSDMGAVAVALGVLRSAHTPRMRLEAATFVCNLAASTGGSARSCLAEHAPVRAALQDPAFLQAAAAMLQSTAPIATMAEPSDDQAATADYCRAAGNAVMVLHWCELPHRRFEWVSQWVGQCMVQCWRWCRHLPQALGAFTQLAGAAAVQQVIDRWSTCAPGSDEDMV